MLDGALRIEPNLPDAWKKLAFSLWWHGQKLHVTLTHEKAVLENLSSDAPVPLTLAGKAAVLRGKLEVAL
jgi:hypothetical glycosyl hydrolase